MSGYNTGDFPLLVTAGSAGPPAWAPATAYSVNQLVTNAGTTYICTTAHTSGASFDSTKFTTLTAASAVTSSAHYDLGRDAFGNMAIGSSLSSVVPGVVPSRAGYNVAVGRNALINLTQGSFNTALGDSALANFTTSNYGVEPQGGENTAVGQGCLNALVDGFWNAAVGRSALAANVHGLRNTAVGTLALASLNGNGANDVENTGVGFEVMNNATTGQGNTAIGALCMANGTPMTGSFNTGCGHNSLNSLTTGTRTVAVGESALSALTTGLETVAVGDTAGVNSITGSYNTFLGRNAGPAAGSDPSWTLCIGRGTSVTQWGAMAIGTDSAGTSATSTTQDNIALGTALSTLQLKNNATGAGSALLGSNCPAITVAAPFTWFKMRSNDGSVVYVPAWK